MKMQQIREIAKESGVKAENGQEELIRSIQRAEGETMTVLQERM